MRYRRDVSVEVDCKAGVRRGSYGKQLISRIRAGNGITVTRVQHEAETRQQKYREPVYTSDHMPSVCYTPFNSERMGLSSGS